VEGGEMAQAFYAYMNKQEKKRIDAGGAREGYILSSS
jgi:hypothetical protein